MLARGTPRVESKIDATKGSPASIDQASAATDLVNNSNVLVERQPDDSEDWKGICSLNWESSLSTWWSLPLFYLINKSLLTSLEYSSGSEPSRALIFNTTLTLSFVLQHLWVLIGINTIVKTDQDEACYCTFSVNIRLSITYHKSFDDAFFRIQHASNSNHDQVTVRSKWTMFFPWKSAHPPAVQQRVTEQSRDSDSMQCSMQWQMLKNQWQHW